MTRPATVDHQFVDVVPDDLVEGIVYVCIPHTTAIHLCLCGCGEEVVTPIKPTGWRLSFNGVAVSLHPSIGNWDFPCHSHYWITDGRVHWDRQWSAAEITAARRQESAHRTAYFDQLAPVSSTLPAPTPADPTRASAALRLRAVPRLIRLSAPTATRVTPVTGGSGLDGVAAPSSVQVTHRELLLERRGRRGPRVRQPLDPRGSRLRG